MKFSFMTFSCPELGWDEVLEVARRFGYEGVEPRAQAQHAHGIEVNASAESRAAARKKAEEAGVGVACLATSCRYTMADQAELGRMLEETRALIALAHDVGAPCLRVFGGGIPQEMSRADAAAQVADALASVADEAQAAGVTLCVETHDSWCDARELAQVIARVGHPHVAVNWDLMHPVRAGLSMDEAFQAVGHLTRHVHFHDGRPGAKGLELCPVGEGVVDHRRAVELLAGIGYGGYVSGEWIHWEPWETHLPRELATLRSYLREAPAR